MEEINFAKIEKKWQDRWEKEKVFEVAEDKKKQKFYVLEMFPYPSGSGLHMGHAWNYSIGDIFSRFKRMQGFNVLHPMGYDALGLPAENAAIKAGEHPEDYTNKSIKNYIKQQKNLGLSYDWTRMVNTADPDYYHWDQWIFLKMLEKGLVYEKEAAVNWCSKCNTILANEQVHEGRCWRHEDTEAEIKQMKQWFLKITDYADRLLEGHKSLKWPEKTIAMQKNWIGKSFGTEIDFEINNPDEIKKEEYVFFHAYKDNSKSVFWPWLKKEIEAKGGKVVFAPDFPNSDEPNIEKWTEFAMKNYKFNENTVIITHSLGGVLALKLLPKLKTKIKKLILVATPSMNKLKDGVKRPAIDNCCDWKFDYEAVKEKVEEVIVLVDETDHLVRIESGKEIADKLGGKLIIKTGEKPHYNSTIENAVLDSIFEKWPVFTTRPDTIFGVTFMVVSAQHKRLNELVTEKQKKEVESFLKKLKSVSEKEMADMEKEGVFTGSYAINPANGEKVPVYVGNFVVADYGAGMVMAVPAHDQRDFEFMEKMNKQYAKTKGAKIEKRYVILPGEKDFKFNYAKDDASYKDGVKESPEEYVKRIMNHINNFSAAWTGPGKIVNSHKEFDGLDNEEAKKKITDWLISKKVAQRKVNYKLRDWSVARQRYWGTPIPLIHCEKCGVVAVPEKDLPVKLPREVKFGEGNPLLTNKKWLNVKCPKCNGKATREANTLDTFVNSSWYFLRYCDAHNKKEIFAKDKVKYWMPVGLYIGGAEHACMHLIYSRFYTMFLHDLGLIDFDEFAPRLFHQGMLRAAGGEKMSKSKGNVVLPEVVSEKYGIDTARFFLCSLAAPDKDIDWDDNGIQGSLRFVRKIYSIPESVKFGKDSEEVLDKLNKTIKNVGEQIEALDYRKSTIELRELFDLISKQKEVSKETFEKALKILSPFCPHLTEELWEKLGNKNFISLAEWPKYVEKKETKKVDVIGKIIGDLKSLMERISQKQEIKKIYLYVMPFELKNIDKKKIEKETGKIVEIFAVNDSAKYDPKEMSKRALPGKPGVYFE